MMLHKPPTNVLSQYQCPIPYSFQDIAQTRFYRSRSLWQGQRSNLGHTMMLHTYTPEPISPPRINFVYLIVSEKYSFDKILKVNVTTTRSKVKSRSQHATVHLHLLIWNKKNPFSSVVNSIYFVTFIYPNI